MSRECDLSKKKPLTGNNVSHSKRRTKMRQEPNLQKKRFYDEETNSYIRLRVTTAIIKTIAKKGLRPTLIQYGMPLPIPKRRKKTAPKSTKKTAKKPTESTPVPVAAAAA